MSSTRECKLALGLYRNVKFTLDASVDTQLRHADYRLMMMCLGLKQILSYVFKDSNTV